MPVSPAASVSGTWKAWAGLQSLALLLDLSLALASGVCVGGCGGCVWCACVCSVYHVCCVWYECMVRGLCGGMCVCVCVRAMCIVSV